MKRIELLDYARLVAALSVVAYHYTYVGISIGLITTLSIEPILLPIVRYAAVGVDFFFIISGYVIFYSTQGRRASEFLTSRVLRLYPLFVSAVIFVSGVSYFWGGEQIRVTLGQIAANLTMFPGFFGFHDVDGVYWTLRCELFFYAAVFFALLIVGEKRLPLVFRLWPVAILLAQLSGLDGIPLLSGLYAHFAVGALFALMKIAPSASTVLSLLLAVALCIQTAAGYAAIRTGYSPWIASFLSIFMVSFMLFINTDRGSALRLPGSRTAGALTYPVYLIHCNFGYIVLSKFATEHNKLIWYFAVVSSVLVLAYLLHVGVERKMFPIFRTLIDRSIGELARMLECRIGARRSDRTHRSSVEREHASPGT